MNKNKILSISAMEAKKKADEYNSPNGELKKILNMINSYAELGRYKLTLSEAIKHESTIYTLTAQGYSVEGITISWGDEK